MKATAIIAGALLALASTAALAQDMSRDQLNQRPSQMKPESGTAPTQRMNESSQGGVQSGSGSSGSGALMQQREQGMSPEGSQPGQGSSSTGKMKQ